MSTLPISTLLAAEAAPLEARVRAAFLFNFARFTEWPAPKSDGELTFCVVADEHVHSSLAASTADKSIRGLRLIVRQPTEPAAAGACDLLYLPDLPSAQTSAWLNGVQQQPVLTVSEGREFARRGGMVGFHLVERRLRFAINPHQVHRSGMQMSSRLLVLADIEQGAY